MGFGFRVWGLLSRSPALTFLLKLIPFLFRLLGILVVVD